MSDSETPAASSSPSFRFRLTRTLVRFASSWGFPTVFFLFTVLSTLTMGGLQGMAFWSPELFPPEASLGWLWQLALHGAPFSFTILAILFCHEMGHFLTARRYGLDATLPFFIPFPISFIGTLGAFIVIKSRFPHRKALIDIGLAGPFAGFLAALPALVVGISTSRPSPPLPAESSITFGEPLLFYWFVRWIWPDLPDGYTLYVSPVGLAAWFGLLLTALNLLPVGQLDGGHASYALFERRAHRLSAWAFFAFLPMAYFGPSWLIWAVLLYLLGIRRPHPPTLLDVLPLPRSRKVMGIAAVAVFVLCFTPEPIEFSWVSVWREMEAWLRGS